MIHTHTASPVRINKIDMNKIGQGTGITRYASGMYFGGPSTVESYLSTYKDFNDADKRYFHRNVEVPPEAKAYPVMDFLTKNKFDYTLARAHFARDSKALSVLDMLSETPGREKPFQVESGVCYQVDLRGVSDEDMLRWRDNADDDMIERVTQALYSKLYDSSLSAVDFDALGIEETDLFVEFVDSCCYAAYEAALEQDELSFSADYDALLAAWQAKARGDNVFDNGYERELDTLCKQMPEGQTQTWWQAMSSLMQHSISLHVGMTHGDIYDHVGHILHDAQAPDVPKKLQKQLAAEFCNQALHIVGYKCDSIYGIAGSQEYVIIDPWTLENAVFTEITHQALSEAVEMETRPAHADTFSEEPDYDYTPGRSYR